MMSTSAITFGQLYKSACLTYQSYYSPRKYLWQNKGSTCIQNANGMTCYVTPHPKTNTLYVVFKGTTTMNELKTSLSASLERRGHPIMHRGYLNKYLENHQAIKGVIKKQSQNLKNCQEVIFTGHSYGGGLSVAASMITKLFYSDVSVKCIAFASPKCVNVEYIDIFQNEIPHLSVENLIDPIPYIGFHPDLRGLPNKLVVDGRTADDVFLLDLWGQHSTGCYKTLVQDLQVCQPEHNAVAGSNAPICELLTDCREV